MSTEGQGTEDEGAAEEILSGELPVVPTTGKVGVTHALHRPELAAGADVVTAPVVPERLGEVQMPKERLPSPSRRRRAKAR